MKRLDLVRRLNDEGCVLVRHGSNHDHQEAFRAEALTALAPLRPAVTIWYNADIEIGSENENCR